MQGASNRRNFFRLLAGETARRAKELAPQLASLEQLSDLTSTASLDAAPPRTKPAETTTRTVTVDEMLSLAEECGLGRYSDALRQLARTSVRLAPGSVGAGSHRFAGGTPPLAGIEWPRRHGRDLRLLVALDLAGIAALGTGMGLPSAGRLWVFQDVEAIEPEPGGRPGTAVVFEPGGGSEHIPADATALTAAGELVLPRAWSTPADMLGLPSHDRDAWQTLRLRLAEAQGVTCTDGDLQVAPIHRVRGYPDERYGDMPLACELRARGIDLGSEPPRTHPSAAAIEARSDRWRLLLQLSGDDALGWSWGTNRRLYLWLTVESLAEANFDGVQAIVQ